MLVYYMEIINKDSVSINAFLLIKVVKLQKHSKGK